MSLFTPSGPAVPWQYSMPDQYCDYCEERIDTGTGVTGEQCTHDHLVHPYCLNHIDGIG